MVNLGSSFEQISYMGMLAILGMWPEQFVYILANL